MKLTKTELELIALARKSGGTYSIETGYGRGPNGGKIQYGVRERNAMFKLIKRGFAIMQDRSPWQDYNRGHGIGGNIFVFRLFNI